jgi:hypothetical protein
MAMWVAAGLMRSTGTGSDFTVIKLGGEDGSDFQKDFSRSVGWRLTSPKEEETCQKVGLVI